MSLSFYGPYFKIDHFPMSYYKKTSVWRQILFSRGMIVALFVAIIIVGLGVASVVEKSIDASRNRKRAEAEAVTLEKKETDLSKKLDALQSPAGQEAALREQFPVVRPGEGVVVIVQDDKKEKAPTEEKERSGFWKFLKNLFSLDK